MFYYKLYFLSVNSFYKKYIFLQINKKDLKEKLLLSDLSHFIHE